MRRLATGVRDPSTFAPPGDSFINRQPYNEPAPEAAYGATASHTSNIHIYAHVLTHHIFNNLSSNDAVLVSIRVRLPHNITHAP